MTPFQSAQMAGRGAQLALRGEPVIYTPMSPPGDPVTVTAIITNPRSIADVWPGQYHGLEVLKSGAAGDAVRGDLFQFSDSQFTVFDRHDPGDGMVALRLSKDS